VHPGVFEGYLRWLYTGVVISSFPIDKPSAFDLAEFSILGDFLDETVFRNAVLDAITGFAYEMWSGICSVNLVWENKPGVSPLRKSILEIWAEKPMSLIVEKLVNGGMSTRVLSWWRFLRIWRCRTG
jgi:hypothetical protein